MVLDGKFHYKGVYKMNINYFKKEIERGIRVLGKDIGELQNDTDIETWHKEGYINEQECKELKRYNRKLCR